MRLSQFTDYFSNLARLARPQLFLCARIYSIQRRTIFDASSQAEHKVSLFLVANQLKPFPLLQLVRTLISNGTVPAFVVYVGE